jgi:hypothetical protein
LGRFSGICFFAPVANVTESHEMDPFAFADDLNAMLVTSNSTSNDIALDVLSCQASLHKWGADNRVKFDPGKEHLCILSRMHPFGNDFELFGVMFDCQLIMEKAVDTVASKANAKLRALLRARKYMSLFDLVLQYKSHILCLLEYPTPAIYHASCSVLANLDRVQSRFLREINVSESEAFLNWGLCPLSARRDVAMLGLLHKVSLGQAHDALLRLFPSAQMPRHTHVTRANARQHNRQIVDRCDGSQSSVMHRSIFGLVPVYNGLPQECMNLSSVSSFQTYLTRNLRAKCKANAPHWHLTYASVGHRVSVLGY